MRQMPHALGDLLLRLYRLTREADAPEFKTQAFSLIREYLPFESGLWGAMAVPAPDQTHVHWVHLDNQTMEMIANWQKHSADDASHRDASEVFGRTVTVNMKRQATRYPAALLEHARTYQICHSLSTVTHDPLLNLRNAVSFYRGWSSKAYTEGERQFVQDLIPHLTEAWNVCAIRYVEQAPSGPSLGVRAVIDRAGSIHNAEPGFAEAVRVEFAGWVGPALPSIVIAKDAAAGDEVFRGRAVVIVKLRDMDDGMRLIGVRLVDAALRLSPRELTVATAFANGSTYQQIARQLGVAPKTVRNQLQSAYAKLGVTTKIALSRRLTGN